MKTNHYSKTAKGLRDMRTLADNARDCGNIDNDQHKELKKKIRSAQLDNLFAAMAAYCKK